MLYLLLPMIKALVQFERLLFNPLTSAVGIYVAVRWQALMSSCKISTYRQNPLYVLGAGPFIASSVIALLSATAPSHFNKMVAIRTQTPTPRCKNATR